MCYTVVFLNRIKSAICCFLHGNSSKPEESHSVWINQLKTIAPFLSLNADADGEIQDFPDGDGGRQPLSLEKVLLKTAWKWKKLDQEKAVRGGRCQSVEIILQNTQRFKFNISVSRATRLEPKRVKCIWDVEWCIIYLTNRWNLRSKIRPLPGLCKTKMQTRKR